MSTEIEYKLFSELYKVATLIEKTVVTPGVAFESYINTGEEALDSFFKEFWNLAGQSDYEAIIRKECETLISSYPAFSLIQHVIGIWLYADTNAFHYYMKPVLVTYALRWHLETGGKLNEYATTFLQKNTLAAFVDFATTEPAFKYLTAVSPELCPPPQEGESLTKNYRGLFNKINITPYAFTPAENSLMSGYPLATGMPLGIIKELEEEISWYASLLSSFETPKM